MTEIRWKTGKPENTKVHKEGGVIYLSYPALDRKGMVCHGFSTRLGGVSQGVFRSMNLGFGRGDDKENVLENFGRIAGAIGFSREDIVTADQTHTTNVREITKEDRGNVVTKERAFHNVDGMITDVPGLILTTFYADCVPLYFVDPVHKAIGLSHSGWRGTAGKIGKVTLEKMRKRYGTDPSEVVAAIGPSICRDCYEVSEDVIQQFQQAFPREDWESLYDEKADGKYQLDLWQANRLILLEAGVLPDRIIMPEICTCCNPEFLFSHRASGGKRGNLAAFLGLREF